MYDLLKNLYPKETDARVDYLEGLEKDSRNRAEMLELRAEVYDEIQDILNTDVPDTDKLAQVQDKLEKLQSFTNGATSSL